VAGGVIASENPLSKAAELGNANSLTQVDGIILNTLTFSNKK
jgi:hypothetical protein